jgi:hypothetical protein
MTTLYKHILTLALLFTCALSTPATAQYSNDSYEPVAEEAAVAAEYDYNDYNDETAAEDACEYCYGDDANCYVCTQPIELVAPFQITLFNPIQLYADTNSVQGLRLNLIYGSNVNVTGVDIGLINHVQGNLSGEQIGICNVVGGDVVGAQGGICNVVYGDVYGAQSSLINFVGGNLSGVQSSYLGNQVAGHVKGFQISCLYNHAESVTGLQYAAFNHTYSMCGLQLGLINYTDDLYGIQIGLINIQTNRAIFKAVPIINASF